MLFFLSIVLGMHYCSTHQLLSAKMKGPAHSRASEVERRRNDTKSRKSGPKIEFHKQHNWYHDTWYHGTTFVELVSFFGINLVLSLISHEETRRFTYGASVSRADDKVSEDGLPQRAE